LAKGALEGASFFALVAVGGKGSQPGANARNDALRKGIANR
jgi:hypothetical protein